MAWNDKYPVSKALKRRVLATLKKAGARDPMFADMLIGDAQRIVHSSDGSAISLAAAEIQKKKEEIAGPFNVAYRNMYLMAPEVGILFPKHLYDKLPEFRAAAKELSDWASAPVRKRHRRNGIVTLNITRAAMTWRDATGEWPKLTKSPDGSKLTHPFVALFRDLVESASPRGVPAPQLADGQFANAIKDAKQARQGVGVSKARKKQKSGKKSAP